MIDNKYAATKELSMADIAVMTYLSILVFNPLYWDIMKDKIFEFPSLRWYIEKVKPEFGDYFETRPKSIM